ncbi:MAG: dTDP-glucose 4,6-dehydratase [Clostridia bacterium]|nr:dTDP-glucose 4,6-dehydratase [Clostridia bacterium]
MTVIVTGGAGFIGSNFVLYMHEKYPDLRIVSVDCLTYASSSFVKDKLSDDVNFRFSKTDICDRKEIYRLFEEEKPDVIVNFAAESHVDRSIDGSEQFLRTNVLGTGVLLDACLKYGIKRFHQISTDEVYGDLPLEGDNPPFTESSPLNPGNPYSASKAAADMLVLSYAKTHRLPVTISRSVNNYGPLQHGEKFIPTVINSILRGKDIPVYGKGKNVRGWLYVRDHCAAIDLILKNGREGEIYNVGADDYLKNIDLVRLICDRMGASEDLITFVTDRPGHDRRYAIDHTLLTRTTGWKPETAFCDGIEKTIEYYK